MTRSRWFPIAVAVCFALSACAQAGAWRIASAVVAMLWLCAAWLRWSEDA